MLQLLGRLSVVDRIGLVLVVIWIVWSATTSLLNGRLLSPLSTYAVAPFMLVIGVALGRRAAEAAREVQVDAALVLGTSVFFLWELLRGGPEGGPLGYANANAALAVQLLALTGLAAVTSARGRQLRVVALVGMTAVILDIASRAGMAVALPVLVAGVLALTLPMRHRGWSIAAALTGLVAVTAAAGGNIRLATMSSWPQWANAAFDPARRALWSDAVVLWQQHRMVGAGPGAFQDFSPLASDPDTDTAHSSLLQVTAETGLIGVVLFVALLVWGYVIATQGQARRAVIGITAWSALAIHSFVDHLLEFPLVVLAAGLVLGWAGSRTSEELDVGQREGPVGR